jgi:DNA-binding XRE family transcriptional regulator
MIGRKPSLSIVKDHFYVPNSPAYHALRQVVSFNNFVKVEDSPWPTAELETTSDTGQAQLKPLEADANPLLPPEKKNELTDSVWKQLAQLSDAEADVLDMLFAIWLEQAKSPADTALASVDQLLAMRGLQPKRGERGRSSGYRPEQRGALCDSLLRVEDIWMSLSRHEFYATEPNGKRPKRRTGAIQSRAVVMTDRLGQVRADGHFTPFSFRFRPGDIFSQLLSGPVRQIALLSVKAVEYDPYRQRSEKRLARYLSWQWRIRASSGTYLTPFKVKTLLDALGTAATWKRPHRMRDRLEKALETLEEDGVIQGWQYERWDEDVMNRRGWVQLWLNARVVIEPPDVVKDNYRPIHQPDAPKRREMLSSSSGLGERVRQQRLEFGMSQLFAAQQIGINHNLLCMVEKGRRKPSRNARRKIEEWLARINKK